MKTTKLFTSFFESEKAGGIILIICTCISIFLANSTLSESYQSFWHIKIGGMSLEHYINDGLMAVFFLLIGLELEREIYIGELSNIRNAMLPIMGALGGMVVPALVYYLFNHNTPYQNGIGIPMATDIAFAIGILSLLGNKVPTALKIFLTALAVIDDLGAIIVIAIFYSKELNLVNLSISLGILVFLLILNRMKVYKLWPYLILGITMWYFMLHSGVHATITGVLLAFAIPFQRGEKKSISYQLEHKLHKPVAFIILPIFALANTAIALKINNGSNLPSYAVGIILGLVLGKPIGIFSFSYIAVKLKVAELTKGLTWPTVFGTGILGGIGFTMSIFVTLLAFTDSEIINSSKLYIILASLTAGILGLVILKSMLRKPITD
ncbi:Na+/H+ antiporter NhaA [Flavobacterium amniphilum]|uniref:Na+/H+ antiporter NhaA n=1 Tax=Flavobacterium amniphilum TaxID=1834035 RepID=UPI00202A883B|nr:Na+/H+ antiporter NhaA [Flavobacterium amniphilum]MCL9806860.1 Na+/H+ antiporter NhaA [Flavobacterium amniphilum]